MYVKSANPTAFYAVHVNKPLEKNVDKHFPFQTVRTASILIDHRQLD